MLELSYEAMEFFKLSREPFELQPRSHEFYRSATYNRAVRKCCAILRGGKIGIVTGHVGTGKTTLMRDICIQAAKSNENTPGGKLELIDIGHADMQLVSVGNSVYGAVHKHFNNQYQFPPMKRNLTERYDWLKDFIANKLEPYGTSLGIIMDEMQEGSYNFMLGLKKLTEMTYGNEPVRLGILMLGKPALKEKLQRISPDVYKRVVIGNKIIELGKYTMQDTKGYITHRLGCVKLKGSKIEFHESAFKSITNVAKSVMDINELAMDAMEMAYRSGSTVIKREHVYSGMSLERKLERTGLTLTEAGKMIGMSASAISEIKRGIYPGKPEKAKELERSLDEILEGRAKQAS